MNSNSTLLIDVSQQGKIEIIDLQEIIELDNQFSDMLSRIEKSNLKPSQQVIEKILNEL